jgi:beta-phosphoglucomutase-like phosphatase (HAD superfamily)
VPRRGQIGPGFIINRLQQSRELPKCSIGCDCPPCAALSSSPEPILRKLGLTTLRRCFGGNLFSATPNLFLYAAQRISTAPYRCLVMEDSRARIDAASAASMTAIDFCGGSHCEQDHGARLQHAGQR